MSSSISSRQPLQSGRAGLPRSGHLPGSALPDAPGSESPRGRPPALLVASVSAKSVRWDDSRHGHAGAEHPRAPEDAGGGTAGPDAGRGTGPRGTGSDGTGEGDAGTEGEGTAGKGTAREGTAGEGTEGKGAAGEGDAGERGTGTEGTGERAEGAREGEDDGGECSAYDAPLAFEAVLPDGIGGGFAVTVGASDACARTAWNAGSAVAPPRVASLVEFGNGVRITTSATAVPRATSDESWGSSGGDSNEFGRGVQPQSATVLVDEFGLSHEQLELVPPAEPQPRWPHSASGARFAEFVRRVDGHFFGFPAATAAAPQFGPALPLDQISSERGQQRKFRSSAAPLALPSVLLVLGRQSALVEQQGRQSDRDPANDRTITVSSSPSVGSGPGHRRITTVCK